MPIYKQYDQAALDRQYNNRLQVPDYATYLERCESFSRQTEKEYPVIKDIVYGKLSREQLDIYPSPQPQSKTLIFIHGGYWQKLDKSSVHFVAKAFRSYNITTVLINYPLAPFVSMDQIVLSCRQAVQWAYNNISQYNGNPGEIYVAGHSAGGHLAVMLLCTDPIAIGWNDLHFNAAVIKGACALSGLFNLTPIRLSDINQGVKMDEETANRNSPVRLKPMTKCPLILTVGTDETDEFKDQTNELYTCWKESIPIDLLQIQGANHYSILETMLDQNASLHGAMRRLMGI